MTTLAIDAARFAELQATAGADFVAELGSARATDDAGRFRRAAHSLKSNSHTFGALPLGELARELELSGMSPDPARDAARLDALEAEYGRAANALKGLRHG